MEIMVKVGKWIARHRILVLLIGVLLIVPSIIGIAKTKVNYDLLSYLPDHLETVKGQDILVDSEGFIIAQPASARKFQTPKHWLSPIPLQQVQLSKGTLEQNPGW